MNDLVRTEPDLALSAATIDLLHAHNVVSRQPINAESCPDGVFGQHG
jgi:hypothetical protein